MTDQTTPDPKPLATRAADALAWLTTFSPAINASIIAIVTAIVTFSGTMATQHYLKPAEHLVIQAADKPKPEPAPLRVMVQPLDGLESRIAQCGAKIDAQTDLLKEIKGLLPAAKVPPKVGKTKTAKILK